MKRLTIILIGILDCGLLFAQKDKKYVQEGNKLYGQKKYAEAEERYRKSLEQSKVSVPGNFNLGDAFYRQKKYDDAVKQFTEIAGDAKDKTLKAGAYHNLGNTLLESKKLKESVEAYKQALINNPKDEETRYNLAYAMEKLKQQENKDKNKDKNKNKDKSKDKDKDKQDKDKQDQDKKNKDENKKDQDKKDNKNNRDKKNQQQDGQSPQPDKLSKEDAERMLEALKNEEKNTQDKLKKKKAGNVKGRIEKDW